MSLCPVSLLVIKEDLEGWREDDMFTELLFYFDQAKCFDDLMVINENIDILLRNRLKDDKYLQRVLLEEEFGLSESEVTDFSNDGEGKFGINIEPLADLAELLRKEGGNDLSPKVSNSVYFATLGLRCMTFYKEKGNSIFLKEAYKALGYAEQAYWSEIPLEELEKEKKAKISQIRKIASNYGYQKGYGSWKPIVKDLYDNTDWDNELDKDNRSQRTKYIQKELQKKIDDEGLFNGDSEGGVLDRWVRDFLIREYGPAKTQKRS